MSTKTKIVPDTWYRTINFKVFKLFMNGSFIMMLFLFSAVILIS